MNSNNMAEFTMIRERWLDTNSESKKLFIPDRKKKTIEQVIKVVKWLLRPESENEQPLFESGLANTGKILFWIVVAIGMGFLIAQLSS